MVAVAAQVDILPLPSKLVDADYPFLAVIIGLYTSNLYIRSRRITTTLAGVGGSTYTIRFVNLERDGSLMSSRETLERTARSHCRTGSDHQSDEGEGEAHVKL